MVAAKSTASRASAAAIVEAIPPVIGRLEAPPGAPTQSVESRVVAELAGVRAATDRLESFIASAEFATVPNREHRQLLQRQVVVMADLAAILARRIELFRAQDPA